MYCLCAEDVMMPLHLKFNYITYGSLYVVHVHYRCGVLCIFTLELNVLDFSQLLDVHVFYCVEC